MLEFFRYRKPTKRRFEIYLKYSNVNSCVTDLCPTEPKFKSEIMNGRHVKSLSVNERDTKMGVVDLLPLHLSWMVYPNNILNSQVHFIISLDSKIKCISNSRTGTQNTVKVNYKIVLRKGVNCVKEDHH